MGGTFPRPDPDLPGLAVVLGSRRGRPGGRFRFRTGLGDHSASSEPAGWLRVRPDAQLQARVKNLAGLVQRKAAELDLVPELLSTRRELESIARGETTADVLKGWRRNVIGAELLAAA